MAIRISRPAQDLQLKHIEKNEGIDYQTLRAFFDLQIDDFEKQLNELVNLKLIKKEKIDNETIYSITDEGKKANRIGLNEFVKQMVIREAELFLYTLTKCSTELEFKAVKELENSGEIYDTGKGYKIVPGKKFEETLRVSKYERFKTWYGNHEKLLNLIFTIVSIIIGVIGLVIAFN